MRARVAAVVALFALVAACGGSSGKDSGVASGGSGGVVASASTAGGGGSINASASAGGSDPTTSSAGGSGGSDELFFEEKDGLLAVEAEHFVGNDNLGTPRDWYLTTTSMDPAVKPDPDPSHAAGASGEASLEALPDTRVTHGDTITAGENFFPTAGQGATLSYRIWFQTAGTYVVWVRAYSTGSEDNGIHAGIDGTWPKSADRVQFCQGKNAWTWSSAQRDSDGPCGKSGTITMDVAEPGEHVVTFSMREDGFEFDKFVMAHQQLQSGYVPDGVGPPEQGHVP